MLRKVKIDLPSSSDSKAITEISLVQSVITPLLPPVPIETLTVPVHIFSRRRMLALWVS